VNVRGHGCIAYLTGTRIINTTGSPLRASALGLWLIINSVRYAGPSKSFCLTFPQAQVLKMRSRNSTG